MLGLEFLHLSDNVTEWFSRLQSDFSHYVLTTCSLQESILRTFEAQQVLTLLRKNHSVVDENHSVTLSLKCDDSNVRITEFGNGVVSDRKK